eukprot:353578-Chlamydomonas_euryale.AAC.15
MGRRPDARPSVGRTPLSCHPVATPLALTRPTQKPSILNPIPRQLRHIQTCTLQAETFYPARCNTPRASKHPPRVWRARINRAQTAVPCKRACSGTGLPAKHS